MKGIYAVEGTTLTLCLVPEGQDRPSQLMSKAGPSELSFVLRRIEP
jgi:hypothetical protein